MRKSLTGITIVLAVLSLGSSSLATGNPPAPLASPSAIAYTVGTSAALCDFTSIGAAIAAASDGDTIRVEKTLFNEAPLVVDKDLTLEGGYPSDAPSHCLASTATSTTTVQRTGAATARILQVEGATVAISRFIFVSNSHGGGLAALQGSDLTLERIEINSNIATTGGGLRVVDSTVSLTDSSIIVNKAQQQGGGIEVLGATLAASVVMTNTAVSGNQAGTHGAGLYLEGNAQLSTRTGTSITANTATLDGGGIYVKGQSQVASSGAAAPQGSALTLEDTLITSNTATNGGGLKTVGATASLIDCYVTSNQAQQHGGGIEVLGTTLAASVTLTRTYVIGNLAGSNGGGIYLEGDAQATSHDWLVLASNTANQNGGGIYATGQAQVTINASTSQPSVVSGNMAYRDGGGIYVAQGKVTLNGTLDAAQQEYLLVTGNFADADSDGQGDGGGLYASGGATVQGDETLWAGNQAQDGGGVYLNGSTFSGEDMSFYENSAAGDGGGFWAGSGSSLSLSKESEVSDGGSANPNTADNGGGIYAEGGSAISLDDSAVRGNRAWVRGGGVYLTGASSLTASNDSQISFNQTYGFGGIEGGGVYASGAGTTVTVNASRVTGNTAITRGGGLYIGAGASATVKASSTVTNNATLDFVDGGAGAYVGGAGSSLTVSWSEFSSNHSATDGGGILNDGGSVHLIRADLNENYAQQRGGGLFNSGGAVQATQTVFYKNEAHIGNGGGLYSAAPGSTVDLDQPYFVANLAPAANGGGLATYDSELTVEQGFFSGNSSDQEGSALYVTGAATPNEPPARIVNCFILDNTITVAASASPLGGPPAGSSLYVEGTSATLLHNTFASQIQEPSAVHAANGSTVTMTNNIVSNFWVGIRRPSAGTGVVNASYTLFYDNWDDYDTPGVNSSHEVTDDPAFVSAADRHLTETSAAINKGTDAGVTVDWDGESRPWDGGFDIGADEYPDREHIFLPLINKGS